MNLTHFAHISLLDFFYFSLSYLWILFLYYFLYRLEYEMGQKLNISELLFSNLTSYFSFSLYFLLDISLGVLQYLTTGNVGSFLKF